MHISKEILEKLGVKTESAKDVPVTKHEAIQAEKNLEIKVMITKGIERFHRTIRKAKSKTREKDGKARESSESVTIYGQELAKAGLEPMCGAINKFFVNAFDGHSKKYASEAIILSKCIPIKDLENEDADRWSTIAFITLKSVLDSITVGATQTKAILKIASAVEDEARLKYFEEQKKDVFRRTKMWLQRNKKKNYRHKRKIYMYALKKADLEWNGFPKEDKVKLGKLLLELLIDWTGLVEFTVKQYGEKTFKYVKATTKTLDWIEKKKLHSEILKPFKLPMIIEPQDWNTAYDGGYYVKELRPKELSAPLGDTNNQPMQKEENDAS